MLSENKQIESSSNPNSKIENDEFEEYNNNNNENNVSVESKSKLDFKNEEVNGNLEVLPTFNENKPPDSTERRICEETDRNKSVKIDEDNIGYEQESIFDHRDSYEKAEELLVKAHRALNDDSDLHENNDAKLKEIDRLISDLERFNKYEQQKLDAHFSQRIEGEEGEESEEENIQEISNPVSDNNYSIKDHENNDYKEEVMDYKEMSFTHSKDNENFKTPEKQSKIINDSKEQLSNCNSSSKYEQQFPNVDNYHSERLSLFKNDGDLGSLVQDQSDINIENISNEDDFIEDHLLFNQLADEFVLGDCEGDGESEAHHGEIDNQEENNHSKYNNEEEATEGEVHEDEEQKSYNEDSMILIEDEEATPRNFYSKIIQNVDAINHTPRHECEEFKNIEGELRMKVMEDVQEKIHENNVHEDRKIMQSNNKLDKDEFILVEDGIEKERLSTMSKNSDQIRSKAKDMILRSSFD